MSRHAWHAALAGAKHDKIVEAARRLFLERGYSRASMAEIAERAAVSATTLYKHFDSKEALFTGVLDALVARFQSELGQAGSASGTLAHKLRSFGRRYAQLLSEPDIVAMTRLVIAEAPGFVPIARRFHLAMKGPVFHRLEAIIRKAIESGDLVQHAPTDSMGQFLGYIERSVLLPQLLEPGHASDAANNDYVVALGVKTLIGTYGAVAPGKKTSR